MSFRSIVRDVRDGFGSLSRRSFDVRISGGGKLNSLVHEAHERQLVIQNSRWASLPPELLCDVIKRLEESESTWPARKHVVACAAVCKSWREMCKEIVTSPEFCGKITFPVSLKQVRLSLSSILCSRYILENWSMHERYKFCTRMHDHVLIFLLTLVLQPGSRDGTIQCFIKRDKSNLTYHLFHCLSPGKHSFFDTHMSCCLFRD